MTDRWDKLEQSIRSVKAGNKEAFREVIHATTVVLRAYVSFFLDDADAVEDVLQELYIRIYREIDQYTPGTNFMAWVKTMARYSALAERRRLGRKKSARKRYLQELTRRITSEAIKRTDTHPLEDKLAALTRCLGLLSDRVHKLVRLKYFQELSLVEVARASGMRTSAATTALHRARIALAKCMQENK